MIFSLKQSNFIKILLLASLLAIFLGSLLSPSISFAQDSFTGSIVDCVDECGYGDLIQSIQNLINFLVYFATIIAVILFIYAGTILVFSGGNSGKKDDAKKIFWNTTIGFIIVISAWLIVATILTAFDSNVDTPLGDISTTGA
jgi:uncharacterized membrane protein YjgN (DUF898 family)